MINDQTTITSDILIRNGWKYSHGEYNIGKIFIDLREDHCCRLMYNGWGIGRLFYTIGELKAIASALYKVELKFE